MSERSGPRTRGPKNRLDVPERHVEDGAGSSASSVDLSSEQLPGGESGVGEDETLPDQPGCREIAECTGTHVIGANR